MPFDERGRSLITSRSRGMGSEPACQRPKRELTFFFIVNYFKNIIQT